MAITFEQQRKRQQYLAIAISIIVCITVFVLWRGFFTGSESGGSGTAVVEPPQLIIDFTVFDTPEFKEIGTAPESVTIPSTIGRKNPFIPF